MLGIHRPSESREPLTKLNFLPMVKIAIVQRYLRLLFPDRAWPNLAEYWG